jgi:hypothetical protein
MIKSGKENNAAYDEHIAEELSRHDHIFVMCLHFQSCPSGAPFGVACMDLLAVLHLLSGTLSLFTQPLPNTIKNGTE